MAEEYRVLVTSGTVTVTDRHLSNHAAAEKVFAEELVDHPDCEVALYRSGAVVLSAGPVRNRPP